MKHCLVVDDSAVIRKVARRILEELRFTTSEAENGREALDQCRMQMPDAVLLDWNMPVMDGIAFLVALRKEQGVASRSRPCVKDVVEVQPSQQRLDNDLLDGCYLARLPACVSAIIVLTVRVIGLLNSVGHN